MKVGTWQLFFDGWHRDKWVAKACLSQCEDLGGVPVGLVESSEATWGLLYWSRKVFFENHVLDRDNAIVSAIRPREEARRG